MPSIFDLSRDELAAFVAAQGQPGYRARQVWTALYQDLAAEAKAFTTLPTGLRTALTDAYALQALTPVREAVSSDRQTRKILFELADHKRIETVLMSYDKRQTVCISTQAGCAMGCVFCATGQMGFGRHLTAGEIVAQVIWFARDLKARGQTLTNVVIMGMGEPFHNYEATLAAVDRLNDADGFNFGARRMTLSTVGLVPMIERFAAEKRQVNLAVSLHAATDALRSELLPINKKYPLAALFTAVRQYFDSTHRRVTFEWALIAGKNDSVEQARELARLAAGIQCHVNVIPLNPTRAYAGEASTRERAAAFQAMLAGHGVPCTIRVRRGIEISAGCGQLADSPTVV